MHKQQEQGLLYVFTLHTSNRWMSPYKLSRSSQTAWKRSTLRSYLMNPALPLLSTVLPREASAKTFMSFYSYRKNIARSQRLWAGVEENLM